MGFGEYSLFCKGIVVRILEWFGRSGKITGGMYGGVDMLVLITYDVNTVGDEGKRRLRKVAKICVNYGQRVQNSVFECSLDASQLCMVKNQILSVMDSKTDSLRIYNLGNNYASKIEHFGAKPTYLPDDTLIF